jgi:hypothetical protein
MHQAMLPRLEHRKNCFHNGTMLYPGSGRYQADATHIIGADCALFEMPTKVQRQSKDPFGYGKLVNQPAFDNG